MHTTTNPQLGLLDSFMTATISNDFLEKPDRALDWKPMEAALHRMYPATTGHPPHPPLVLFKMSLLQHCYGLSDPQCEQLVKDRLGWRRFVGLGLQDSVPDETTLVNFRKRLRQHGQHEHLLALVNRQLAQKGLILKTCTLVDAMLVQAARRAPAKDDKTGGDGDAGYTVKRGQPHYGYKAHVAVDQAHTLIRRVTLTSASVHDSQEFETVVKGDEAMVMADKAYWSRERSEFSSIRCQIEKVFGWWKRSAGYRWVRYVGREPNRLELEFKSICWNLKRPVNLAGA